VGHLLHLFNRPDGQWTGDDNDACAWHAKRGYPSMGGPSEGTGDDAHGRNALRFGYYCVVETPRRAGASIRDSVNHGVAFLAQRI
jgi:hypothetical protein